MSAPTPRSSLPATAAPAKAPPIPPITAPCDFLSPGKLSQPIIGPKASEPISAVAIIDLKTLTLTGRIATGPGPDGLAWVTGSR